VMSRASLGASARTRTSERTRECAALPRTTRVRTTRAFGRIRHSLSHERNAPTGGGATTSVATVGS
jgi:hypothetical protein